MADSETYCVKKGALKMLNPNLSRLYDDVGIEILERLADTIDVNARLNCFVSFDEGDQEVCGVRLPKCITCPWKHVDSVSASVTKFFNDFNSEMRDCVIKVKDSDGKLDGIPLCVRL